MLFRSVLDDLDDNGQPFCTGDLQSLKNYVYLVAFKQEGRVGGSQGASDRASLRPRQELRGQLGSHNTKQVVLSFPKGREPGCPPHFGFMVSFLLTVPSLGKNGTLLQVPSFLPLAPAEPAPGETVWREKGKQVDHWMLLAHPYNTCLARAKPWIGSPELQITLMEVNKIRRLNGYTSFWCHVSCHGSTKPFVQCMWSPGS